MHHFECKRKALPFHITYYLISDKVTGKREEKPHADNNPENTAPAKRTQIHTQAHTHSHTRTHTCS